MADDLAQHIAADVWTGRYFIYPDSLYLLEPQVGDLIVGADDLRVLGTIIDILYDGQIILDTYAGRFGTFRSNRIIQRNGIAFHWPESEAA